MSRKVKILISALLVALLLTVGATATVMAQEEEETTPPLEVSEKGLLDRVADILGINKEDLIDAFKQAQQEMWDEAFISRLNKAVEEGYITQAQADEITKWWEQRPEGIGEWWGEKPEVLEPGMFKHNLTFRFRAMPMLGFHMRNGPRGWFCPRLPQETE